MFAFFAQLFGPVSNSEESTRKHLLWWILLRVMLISLLCGVGTVVGDRAANLVIPPRPQISIFLLALCVFSIVSAFALQRFRPDGRALRFFGLGQLLSDAFFLAALVYGTGCSESIFAPLFILPIIATGLILHKSGGLLLAATSTLLYAGILFAERFKVLPDYFRDSPYWPPGDWGPMLNLFPFYGLVFFLAALISGQMGSRLHRAQIELRKTAQAYEHLNQLYRRIFNDIATGIITTDAGGRVNSYNQAAAGITGLAAELVLDKPLTQFFPDMARDPDPGDAGRNVCDFEKLDGVTIRIGYSRAPLRTKRGGRDGLARVITLQDISQVERMERQMREAEKLAAIGQMSAMVAHDFRNPLAAISGSAQMLAMNRTGGGDAETGKPDDDITALVAIILRETARMEKTIADFLLFARPEPPQAKWFLLRPVLEDKLARFFAANERYDERFAKISWDIPVDMRCLADQEQLGAAVCQAVDNACMAVQEEYETARRERGPEDDGADILIRARTFTDEEGRDMLALEVRDKGPGIPEELRERVFTPFFSQRAKGAGLGLAVARQIVRQHGGEMSIGEDGEYRCVARITLPQHESAVQVGPVAGQTFLSVFA